MLSSPVYLMLLNERLVFIFISWYLGNTWDYNRPTIKVNY